MNLLLDTHAFMWFVNGDKNLSVSAKKRIENPRNKVFISIASIWEIAIKVSLRKLKLNSPFINIKTQIENNTFEILPVSFEHTAILSSLPFHHRDPFDRIIIAQALSEKMTIVTKDADFKKYKVKTIKA